MKGVIWRIAPLAQIADLSHLISPQDIPEAAMILGRSAPYFPPGTIHVVVVDPGVGTSRRPIAAQLGEQFFVGPDNGALTLLLTDVERQGLSTTFIHLDRPEYWLPEISHVFHGRDIFAPVAGRLAAGAPLLEMGTPVDDPVRLSLPAPERTTSGWLGQVIHIDHFGNLSTNLRREHLDLTREVTVLLGEVSIQGLVDTFGDRPPGSLIALFGSTGNLLVSVVNGNASQHLGARVGNPIEVRF
jgi:S-adenosylmethionine hydrolase